MRTIRKRIKALEQNKRKSKNEIILFPDWFTSPGGKSDWSNSLLDKIRKSNK